MLSIFNQRNFLLLGIIGLLLMGPAKAESLRAVQIKTLMQTGSSWDGVPYSSYPSGQPELTVLKIIIPAHTKLPWHTHPMPNAAYVLSGKLTVELKDSGKKKILTAGEVLPEMVGKIHRGVTGDVPAVLIVFYAGTHGMPLSYPVPNGGQALKVKK